MSVTIESPTANQSVNCSDTVPVTVKVKNNTANSVNVRCFVGSFSEPFPAAVPPGATHNGGVYVTASNSYTVSAEVDGGPGPSESPVHVTYTPDSSAPSQKA